ncbi:MAG TPA: PQQ-binding-like beta-propeller repeat protein [Polyangiaceae bacterium]|jgi:outer membrane protein assembly factor BamB
MRGFILLSLASLACSSPQANCPVADAGTDDVAPTDGAPSDASLDVPDLDVVEAGDAMACPPRKASGTTSKGFQMDVGHTGGQPTDEITLPLCRRWSVPLKNAYASAAAVEDGRVFVVTGIGADLGNVYAFSEQTGAMLWGVNLDSITGFAEENDTVFTTDLSGYVNAFAGDTGAPLWTRPLPNGVAVPPTPFGGRLYVTAASSLNALDEKSGAVLWTQTIDAYGGGPSVAGGHIFLASGIGRAEALDAITGGPVWNSPLTANGSCASVFPVATSTGLYSTDACGGQGAIFDETSGARAGVFTSTHLPAFGDTFAVYSLDTELMAIDVASAAIRWTFKVSTSLEMPPIVVGHQVVAADANGIVYVIDADTGKLLSSDKTDNILQAGGLSEADGMLFLSGNGILIAY